MYKILYLDDFNDVLNSDNWLLTIDVSDVWKKFINKETTISKFLEEYYNLIKSKEKKIRGVSEDGWKEISSLINGSNVEDLDSLYKQLDHIYDCCDKYSIKININE